VPAGAFYGVAGGAPSAAPYRLPLVPMAAPLITAVDPITGACLTRRTARTYFAAVVIDTAKGPKALAWCGRPDLADKRLGEIAAVNDSARLALVVADPWAEPAPAAAESVAEPPAAEPPALTAGEIKQWRDYLHSAPARAVADDLLAALDQLEKGDGPAPYLLPLPAYSAAELSELTRPMARPHLPGETPTPSPATHGTAAPKLPDLNGAADKVAALEFLAGGGALSSDVWVALGWPFEAFLAWAQRPDADARESALRARIRRDGVAACLAAL